MSEWIQISQCDVPGMLSGAVEVTTRHDSGTGSTYYVGQEEAHGETVVRPVDSRGDAIGPEWEVDGTTLDGIELIQNGAECRTCWSTGEHAKSHRYDLALVTVVPCEDCDGKGWVQP